MAQYRVGTVSINKDSNIVTGNNTAFSSEAKSGQEFVIVGEFVTMTILSVDSDTQLTLTNNWTLDSVSGEQYSITRDFTTRRGYPYWTNSGAFNTNIIFARFAQQVDNDIGNLLAGALEINSILAKDGTSDAPAYSFESEPGLGFYRSGDGTVTVQGDFSVEGSLRATSVIQETFLAASNTSRLLFSGSNDADKGANMLLYGENNSTNANDIIFRVDEDIKLEWDNSADRWLFGNNNTYGVLSVVRGAANSRLLLSGGSGSGIGMNIALRGESPGTATRGIIFREGSDNKFSYAYSGSVWSFHDTSITGDNNTLILEASGFRRTVNNSLLTLSGANQIDNIGAAIMLYGGDHSTNANDFSIRSTGDWIIHFDHSENYIKFYRSSGMPVGSAALPSYTFNGDTDTGMYRDGANAIGFSTGGTRRLFVNSDGINVSGQVEAVSADLGSMTVTNGSATIPSYSFKDDTDTGIYKPSANSIGFTAGGSEKLKIEENSITAYVDIIRRNADTGDLMLLGGSSITTGSSITLNGKDGIDPNEISFRYENTIAARLTNGVWYFERRISNVPSITMSTGNGGAHILSDAMDENITIAGGNTQRRGGRLILFGDRNPVSPGDIVLSVNNDDKLWWDNTSDAWKFEDNDIEDVNNLYVQNLYVENFLQAVNTGGINFKSTTSNAADSIIGSLDFEAADNDTRANIGFNTGKTSYEAGYIDFLVTNTTGVLGTVAEFEHDKITFNRDILLPNIKVDGLLQMYRNVDTSFLTIGGGTDFNKGGVIQLFAENHATRANHILLSADGTIKLEWDDGDNSWDFYNYDIKDVRKISSSRGYELDDSALTLKTSQASAVRRPLGSVRWRDSTNRNKAFVNASLGDSDTNTSKLAFLTSDPSNQLNTMLEINHVAAIFSKFLSVESASSQLSSTGELNISTSRHIVDVNGGTAASDDLTSISAPANTPDGSIVILSAANSARTINVVRGNNIVMPSASYSLSSADKMVVFIKNGNRWLQLFRANNP